MRICFVFVIDKGERIQVMIRPRTIWRIRQARIFVVFEGNTATIHTRILSVEQAAILRQIIVQENPCDMI